MLPYFLLLFIIVFFSYIGEQDKKNYKIYFFLIFLILVFFAGFRNVSVGTDTINYVNSFYGINSYADYLVNNSSSKIEPGFLLIQNLAYFLSQDYYSLLLSVSFIILYFQILAIYKISNFPLISFFVFITLGFYTFSFNGMRQAIAAGVFTYAIQFIINGNFKKYIFFIILGFLFHKTIIIALPLYFIFRIKFSIKNILILFVFSFTSSFFISEILQISVMISEKYKVYIEAEQVGGKLLTIFYVVLALFFLFIRNHIHQKILKKYDILLNMFIVGTFIFLTVYISNAYVEITRLAFYFLLSAIFIWPIIFVYVRKKYKFISYIFFIFTHILFYIFHLYKIGNLIPYLLNNTLF